MRIIGSMNHYEVLGVPRDAAQEDIKRAYRQMAMKYHPDRNPGSHQSEERFKDVSLAYEVLGDEHKKQIYDVSLGLRPDGTFDPSFFDPSKLDQQAFINAFVAQFGQYLDDVVPGVRDYAREAVRKNAESRKKKAARRKAKKRKPNCTACKDKGKILVKQGNFEISVTCRRCAA